MTFTKTSKVLAIVPMRATIFRVTVPLFPNPLCFLERNLDITIHLLILQRNGICEITSRITYLDFHTIDTPSHSFSICHYSNQSNIRQRFPIDISSHGFCHIKPIDFLDRSDIFMDVCHFFVEFYCVLPRETPINCKGHLVDTSTSRCISVQTFLIHDISFHLHS